MSITYRFHNLQSLADHLGARAEQKRQDAEWIENKGLRGFKQRALIARTEATTLESVVSMLRATVLEEVRPQ